jgi:hypothetical protein
MIPGKVVRSTVEFLAPENGAVKREVKESKPLTLKYREERNKALGAWKNQGLPNPHDKFAQPKGSILRKKNEETQGGKEKKIRVAKAVKVAVYNRHLNSVDVTLHEFKVSSQKKEAIEAKSGHEQPFTKDEADEHLRSLIDATSNALAQTSTTMDRKLTAGGATNTLRRGLADLKEACAEEAQKAWFSDLFNCYDPVLSACLDSEDAEAFACVLTALRNVRKGDKLAELESALFVALEDKCSEDFVNIFIKMKMNSFSCEGMNEEQIESAVEAFAEKYALMSTMAKNPALAGHYARQLGLHGGALMEARTEEEVAAGLQTLRYKSQTGLQSEMMDLAVKMNSERPKGEFVSGSLALFFGISEQDYEAIAKADKSKDTTTIQAILVHLVQRAFDYEKHHESIRISNSIDATRTVVQEINDKVIDYHNDGLSKKKMISVLADEFLKLEDYVDSQVDMAPDDAYHALLVAFNMHSDNMLAACKAGDVKKFHGGLQSFYEDCGVDRSNHHYGDAVMEKMLMTTLNRYINDEDMPVDERIARVVKDASVITRAEPENFEGVVSNIFENHENDVSTRKLRDELIIIAVDVQLNEPY